MHLNSHLLFDLLPSSGAQLKQLLLKGIQLRLGPCPPLRGTHERCLFKLTQDQDLVDTKTSILFHPLPHPMVPQLPHVIFLRLLFCLLATLVARHDLHLVVIRGVG